MVTRHRQYPLPSLNDFKVLTVNYWLSLMRGDNCFAVVCFVSPSIFPLTINNKEL